MNSNNRTEKKHQFARASAMIFFIAVLVLGFSSSFLFAHIEDESALVAVTKDLLQRVSVYMKASGAGRTNQLSAVTSSIQKRKEQILQLIEKDPALVNRYLFPKELLASFPPEIQELLEVDVSGMEGEISVVRIDSSDFKNGETSYFLNSGGKRYQLHFAGDAPGFLTGEQIGVVDGTILFAVDYQVKQLLFKLLEELYEHII